MKKDHVGLGQSPCQGCGNEKETVKERTVFSLCGFCHANCAVKVHLLGNRISRVEGNPDHPVNKGHLCPKAQAIKPLADSPQRLKTPLRKTRAGFAACSWDEALDLAAERLAKVRGAHGPEGLAHASRSPVTYGGRDGFLQFMGVFGSPSFMGVSNLCSVPRQVTFQDALGGRPEPAYEHARLVIFWGLNPVCSTRFANYAAYDGFHRILPGLKERGAG